MSPPKPGHPLPNIWAEAAYRRAYASAVEHGIWRPEYAIGLEMFGRMVAAYLELARRRLPAADPDLKLYRGLCREQAFQWHLIGDGGTPELRSDGLDPDIASICGLGVLN